MHDSTTTFSDIPPDATTAFALFRETLDFSFELAVQGTMALDGLDRQAAIERVFRVFAEEDRRRLPSLIRMLKATPGA